MARHVAPQGPEDAMGPDDLEQALNIGADLFGQAEAFFYSLLRTWNLYQVFIAIGLFVLAHLLRALLGPRIRAWMASRENWPKWRMRILAIVHMRLRAIFYVALLWLTIVIMREVTWYSRSYLLSLFGTLAFVILVGDPRAFGRNPTIA